MPDTYICKSCGQAVSIHEKHFLLCEGVNKFNAATPEPTPQPGKEKVLDHVVEGIKLRTLQKTGDQVTKDLIDRAELGKNKYGTYLYTGNGRNTLMDFYQEVLDGLMYSKAWLLENADQSDSYFYKVIEFNFQSLITMAVSIRIMLNEQEKE